MDTVAAVEAANTAEATEETETGLIEVAGVVAKVEETITGLPQESAEISTTPDTAGLETDASSDTSKEAQAGEAAVITMAEEVMAAEEEVALHLMFKVTLLPPR